MRLLRGGRVQDDASIAPAARDILVGDDGRIAAIEPAGAKLAAAEVVDLAGKLVVPGFVDAHQHLDKTRTLESVPNPEGTLPGAIKAFRAYAATMQRVDIVARAERTLQACVERGTVALRTHVNVDTETRVRGIEALVELRERWRDRIRLQLVAFVTGAGTNAPEAKSWLDEALAMGADVIGGTPASSNDAEAFYDMLFAAAERTGRPIDLHLDEHLDGALHFEGVIRRTRALGLQGRVVASHCCVLAALPPGEAARLIEEFAGAGIGVVTLPAANLFLQGRAVDRLAPRGLTRVNELARAGVTVACASDNIRDPFVPTGSGDMLEIARWTMLAAHFSSNDVGRAFQMITAAPARLLGLGETYGLKLGARADLLATDAADIADLVTGGPLRRSVFFGGNPIST